MLMGMESHAHGRTHGTRSLVLSGVLTGLAIVLMLVGAFGRVFGTNPGPVVQFLAVVTAAIAVVGAVAAANHGTLALGALWAAFGLSMALGLLGFLSVGMFFLAAGVLIVAAMAVLPSGVREPAKLACRFVLVFAVCFVAIIGFMTMQTMLPSAIGS